MTLPTGFASDAVDPETLPWIPVGPGESVKPLRVFHKGQGRVLLLRLDPGTLVPMHRHLGEVHALNLAGHGRPGRGNTR